MVVVIDYDAGNLYNVGHALRRLGVPFHFSGDRQEVSEAHRVILPGVGSAKAAMRSLEDAGLVDVIRDLKVPFLGICLGLQLLLDESEEEGVGCLGVVGGRVRRFQNSDLKVPHMGWNQVVQKETPEAEALFKGIQPGSYFYFVHSYYAPASLSEGLAETTYGCSFCSALRYSNFWGVQFHPERSGEVGLQVLQNFLGISPCE